MRRSSPPSSEPLTRLAAAYGVATSYANQQGRPITVPEATVRAVLAAMGVAAGDDDEAADSLQQRRRQTRVLPPTVVVRGDRPAPIPLARNGAELGFGGQARLETENGDALVLIVEPTPDGKAVRLPADLPHGYHRLHLEHDEQPVDALLVVAPARCPVPPARSWGWMLQLYALRSEQSWGMGDFADLAALAEWTGAQPGGGFLVCNPVHAAAPVLPQQPSPYFPSSRRFVNPLYLRIEALDEFEQLAPDARQRVAALGAPARALNNVDRVDRDVVFSAKQQALELLWSARNDADEPAFAAFREREGQGLEDFATFCALAGRHGGSYRHWPEALRHPRNRAVGEFRLQLSERVMFHMWLQWLCDEQLANAQRAALDAGMGVGVIHDLAVGVDPGGADAWALQDDLAAGVAVGAPPDLFNQQGQNWQVPPLLPNRLPETGYAPFRDMLRSVLRHAGGIRIDHVMGLFRLFWIPEGVPAAEGTYVSYPDDALLGVLSLEAQRAGAVVVGEDLGTVEARVRTALQDRAVLSSRVLYFERSDDDAPCPPQAYPQLALASVTTHDLPTAAGWWEGEWLRLMTELGLLGEDTDVTAEAGRTAAERNELRAALVEAGYARADAGRDELVEAMYRFLAATPSLLVAASISDPVGDLRQPNLPGTSREYPNWQLPLAVPAPGGHRPLSWEAFRAHPGVRRLAEILADVTR